MELTVGKLEESLRKFPKDTIIRVGCECCHHSSNGEGVIDIRDYTNQTYGYIELNVNENVSSSYVELATDKEQWYKKEIEKLQRIIKNKDTELDIYKDAIKSISTNISIIDKQKKYMLED